MAPRSVAETEEPMMAFRWVRPSVLCLDGRKDPVTVSALASWSSLDWQLEVCFAKGSD